MSTVSSPIPLTTPYVVIDTRTGQTVYHTTYARRNAARRWADRKDLAYGAVRYVAQLAPEYMASKAAYVRQCETVP